MRTVKVGVFVGLAIVTLCLTATPLRAQKDGVDMSWSACIEQPSKACVTAQALSVTRGIADAQIRARVFDQVLSAGDDLKPADLAALARKAEAIALSTKDYEARDEMWRSITAAYVAANENAAAMAVLPRFKNKHYQAEGVVRIAVAVGRVRHIADAVALLQSESATRDNWRAWVHAALGLRQIAVERGEESALMPLLETAQLAKNAERDLDKAHDYVGHTSHLVEPLLVIIAEQVAQGKMNEACAHARAVVDVRARTRIIGGIVAVLSQAGRTDEALEIALAERSNEQGKIVGIALMPDFAAGTSDILTGPFPKIARPAHLAFATSMRLAELFAAGDDRDTAYAIIAHANAREGGVTQAVLAAAFIAGNFALRTTLLKIGEAQVTAGQRAASVETFACVRALINADTPDPNFDFRESQLSKLAKIQGRAGQFEEALAIVRAMKGNEMSAILVLSDGRWVSMDFNRLSAYEEIARALAKTGRLEQAFAVAHSSELPELDLVGTGSGVVAEGLAEAGRIPDALNALKQVAEPSWRDSFLLGIVRGRAKAELISDAEKLMIGFTANEPRALALAEIAAAVARAGEAPRAMVLVRKVLSLSDKFTDENQKAEALSLAAKGLPS